MWVKLFFFIANFFLDPGSIPTPDNPITLHLMMASHTDAGWIYTFEQYYQGTHTQDGGCVKCILNNVLNALPQNSQRKYDMSEISFFNRWWIDQNQDTQGTFKDLVKNNQFGFMNGAWVANDEAAAYYEDIMDNFILGHRWLKNNLDLDTLVGWQVDSFGNSASHAALMAQAGYEGLFFSRADFVDRDKRIADKALQFVWNPPNPHNESVFTQMLYTGYSDSRYVIPESQSCRTIFCLGNLKRDDYDKVEKFLKDQVNAFRTRNILFLVCDDFLMSDQAAKFYDGAEAMIDYYNKRPEKGIKVKFSHLTEYVAQVKKDLKTLGSSASKLPVKRDDFYPYVEKHGHVWTGYFTSKSMYKLMIREYSEYYNAMKLFLAKILLFNNTNADQDQHSAINKALNSMEEPLAIAQHHDSVTGTMKEYVRFDYENLLKTGRDTLEQVVQPVITSYLKSQIKEDLFPSSVKYDWYYQDDNYQDIFESEKTPTLVVFNPGSGRQLLVKVKVPNLDFKIIDDANNQVEIDGFCHSQNSTNECYVYFVGDFAPYSTKIYKILESNDSTAKVDPTEIDGNEDIKIGSNLFLKVHNDLVNFDYKYCSSKSSCVSDSFSLDYEYYQSSQRGGGPPSGAYVFSPDSQSKSKYSKVLSGRVFRGKHLSMVQIFRNNVRTDIKVIHHQPERGIEIDSYLDPVTNYTRSKEIVLIVRSSSISNGNTTFYTDTNGYYMQQRQKNHKDDYQISLQETIAINFYPITSNIYIEDPSSGQRLSIVTDRAQGATSLNPGEIEIMIHRVTASDDWKGVREPLREKDPNTNQLIRVKTRHYLSYSKPNKKILDRRREQQYDLDRSPHLWFYFSKNQQFRKKSQVDQEELVLPNLVKLYVRSYNPNEYIVRLHNMDELNSKQIDIYDLKTKDCTLLNKLAGSAEHKVKAVTELSWMTTRSKLDVLKNLSESSAASIALQYTGETNYSNISLLPMEIRTFSVTLEV